MLDASATPCDGTTSGNSWESGIVLGLPLPVEDARNERMKAASIPLIGILLFSGSTTPAQNNTSGPWTYNLNASNEATILSYSGSGGAVGVPAFIDGFAVKTVGGGGEPTTAPIFGPLNGSVTSVSIPQGVTNIGARAFAYCTNLQSVTIPSSVLTVSLDAFAYCRRLTNVSLSEGVEVIGQGAFLACESLPAVTIPTSVTNVGAYAFAGCVSIQSAKIPQNVLYLAYRVFQGCSNLTTVLVGGGVDEIQGEAFADCPKLSVVFFLGNCPSASGSNHFEGSSPIVYRTSVASGWSNVFLSSPVEVFAAFSAGSAPQATGSFTLVWNGPTNVPMDVQRSTSLNGTWSVMSSNNLSGSFTDTNPATGQAFYRVLLP